MIIVNYMRNISFAVHIPPLIIDHPPHEIAYAIGESIKLKCEATGVPEVELVVTTLIPVIVNITMASLIIIIIY